MTRIDFHLNAADKVGYACRLVRKVYHSGQLAVVFCDNAARLEQFDQQLWTFSPLDFVPHVVASDRWAHRTPVVLTAAAVDTPHHQVLVNLGDGTPGFFSRFERLIEVVGTDPEDRLRARERYRYYRDRGYPLQVHELAS